MSDIEAIRWAEQICTSSGGSDEQSDAAVVTTRPRLRNTPLKSRLEELQHKTDLHTESDASFVICDLVEEAVGRVREDLISSTAYESSAYKSAPSSKKTGAEEIDDPAVEVLEKPENEEEFQQAEDSNNNNNNSLEDIRNKDDLIASSSSSSTPESTLFVPVVDPAALKGSTTTAPPKSGCKKCNCCPMANEQLTSTTMALLVVGALMSIAVQYYFIFPWISMIF